MNKYEDLLEEFMEFIENYDNEILIRGYDLTMLEENIKKAINEA